MALEFEIADDLGFERSGELAIVVK